MNLHHRQTNANSLIFALAISDLLSGGHCADIRPRCGRCRLAALFEPPFTAFSPSKATTPTPTPATAFGETDLFGNPLAPKTEQQSMFGDISSSETVSPDAKTIDSFAGRAGNDALVAAAREALSVFDRARRTRAPLADMLRLQNLDGSTVAENLSPLAEMLVKAMDAGTFDAAMATEPMKGGEQAEDAEGRVILRSAEENPSISLDPLYADGSIDYEQVTTTAEKVISGLYSIERLEREGEEGRLRSGRYGIEAALVSGGVP